MANPLRICHRNEVDAQSAIITTSSMTSLPAANLKDDDIEKLWRGTSTTGSAIRVDLGGQKEIGVIALINISGITSADSYLMRVSTSDPDGINDNVHSSGQLPAPIDPVWRKLVHIIDPPVIGRYVRISLPTTSGPISAGRLVIGPTWAPSRNMQFGREKLWRDHSTRTRSLGGNEYVDVRARQWGWRFTLRGLTELEAQQQVDHLNRQCGIGRDILLCVDKDSSNIGRDTLWGLLEWPAQQRQDHHGLWTVEFEVWNRI